MASFDLSLQDPGGSLQELVELGDGGPLPADAEVLAHRRFELLARAQPDLTAIVSRDASLGYGELDSRAAAVAARLHELGVGREDVVGICLPHRLDMVVAVYGVLKSGAAYLPLDVAQPLARRRFMLSDTRAAALITIPAWKGELGDRSMKVMIWDARGPSGSSSGSAGAAPDPSLDDLAYVIYTSGSTG